MMFFVDTAGTRIRTLPMSSTTSNRLEDLDTEGEDHAVDDIRYACMSRPFGARVERGRGPQPAAGAQCLTTGRTDIDGYRCVELPDQRLQSMPSTTYGQATNARRASPPPRLRPTAPTVQDVTSTEDIDLGWWEKALSDAERAEKNWRARGRDIVQIYRGDIPITRPKGGKYNSAISYSHQAGHRLRFQHLVRQHRSDAAGGLLQAAGSRRRIPFRQEDRRPDPAAASANDGPPPDAGPPGMGPPGMAPGGLRSLRARVLREHRACR